LIKLLNREGYTPLAAADGASALELLKTSVPDIIFLDLLMPGMDGNQFLVELNKLAINTNVGVEGG
jgi:CheY-like chemotaxis protein